MAEKKVSVRLVAENGRQVRAELEGVGDAGARGFQRMSKEIDTAGVMLRRLAGIAAGALSIRQVAQYADTWTDLRSRVDLATGSHEKGALVMERLASMARRTYSDLGQTAESWLASSTALRELGLSTRESLDFTEALNNAMVVSGAKAERAASVQNALSRAMASGKLSGDQLNTIIETGGRVAELLAEELGTTVSGLRTMGQQGKITGAVIRTALVGNLELLREEADSMPATIGDAFTLIGNAALTLVGSFDQAMGASSLMADALILVADNIERIAVIAVSFAAFMAGRWVVAFVAARVATFSLAASLVTLRAALIRTGIGALIVAAGELVYWLGRVVVASDGVGTAFWRVFNVAKEVFLGVGRTAWGLMEILAGIASGITGSFVRAFAEIARAWDVLVNGMAAAWNAIAGTSLGETLGMTEMGTSDVSGTLRGLADTLFEGGEASIRRGGQRIVDAGRSVADAFATSVESGAEAGTDALDDAAASADRVAEALEKTGNAAGRAGAAGKKAGKDIKDGSDEAKVGWDAVAASLSDYAEKARNIGADVGKALVGAFQSAENAIGDFVKTGKMNFRDLVTSMLADLAKLGARRFLLGPLAAALGSALGGMGGNIFANVLHGGGMVGAAGPGRMVPATVFAGAPRMHSGGWAGLRSDEVPAILQKGERVLSRREARRLRAGRHRQHQCARCRVLSAVPRPDLGRYRPRSQLRSERHVMAFHEIRFPDNISRGARGGPARRTQIVELASGDEERNASWADSRRRYDVSYGIRRADDLHAVVEFFEARNGRLHGFRFKDWSDYKSCQPSGTPGASDQMIGTGDGSTTTFQLVKRYASGAQAWMRTITRPVAGSVTVSLGGTPQPSGWTVDTATGIVTFSSPPGNGIAIRAGFEFDVPVRFDSDVLDVTLDIERLGSITSIPLLEIRR